MKDALSLVSHDVQMVRISYDELGDSAEDIKAADIIIVCLNFDVLYPDFLISVLSRKVTYEDIKKDCFRKCRKLYLSIKENTNAHIIWFGFEDYFCLQNNICGAATVWGAVIDQLNLMLSNMLEDDSFVDLKRLIATTGIVESFDSKGKYRWNTPYSKELIRLMTDEIRKQHLISTGITKKCVVLDCDNVLWGGILSEDGIEGIQIGNSGLGRPFWDFQRFLVTLYYHGVILTVCSKNDEVDVLNVFRNHSGMLLKEEYISCFRCNWDNKPNNINMISKTLNIGLDSIVFIDDSVFEVEAVKSMFPMVTSIQYDRDAVYKDLSCFNLKSHIDFDNVKKRTETYRTNVKREALKEASNSFDEYISCLNMKIDIHQAKFSELARIAELTMRTNKCTNGQRYSLEKLKEKTTSREYVLYTVCLSDKFSDLGIVGAMGVDNNIIDLFSLSCRALGRSIEEKMLLYLKDEGAKEITFIKTFKNSSLVEIIEKLGYHIIHDKNK